MNVGQAIINLRKEKFNTGNLITAKTEKMISFSRKK